MKVNMVVPCFNEEDSLPLFVEAMEKLKKNIYYDFEIIFVDDGSKDSTPDLIKKYSEKYSGYKYIILSRNFGKESAMFAGFEYSDGDYIGVMDADLQHPPELIPQMIEALDEGYDVCATRRVNRAGASATYQGGASFFYKIINNFGENVKLEEGVQDFRLMKRRVVNSILSLREKSRFSKGIFSWIGFKTKYIETKDTPRLAGESKWNFFKSISYALDGIISFTVAPLRACIYIGTITSFLGFIYALYIILRTLVKGRDFPGFASIISILLVMGGLILLFMGVLGEYIGRIYKEVKSRPIYISMEDSNDKK